MIYLAKNKKGHLKRIQVCFLRRKCCHPKWGALNFDGTEKVVPFVYETHAEVVNELSKRYKNSTITVSRRIVDKTVGNKARHIICIDKRYHVYDSAGNHVGFDSPYRISFTDYGYEEHSSTQFPDYYEEIEVIHKDKLWVAKDIDTGLWVSIQSNGNVVTQNRLKQACISDAVKRLS